MTPKERRDLPVIFCIALAVAVIVILLIVFGLSEW
jgi:hypothetical protein